MYFLLSVITAHLTLSSSQKPCLRAKIWSSPQLCYVLKRKIPRSLAMKKRVQTKKRHKEHIPIPYTLFKGIHNTLKSFDTREGKKTNNKNLQYILILAQEKYTHEELLAKWEHNETRKNNQHKNKLNRIYITFLLLPPQHSYFVYHQSPSLHHLPLRVDPVRHSLRPLRV